MIELVVLLTVFVAVSVLGARQAIAWEEQRREEEAAEDIARTTGHLAETVRDLGGRDPMVMTAAERAARDVRLSARVTE